MALSEAVRGDAFDGVSSQEESIADGSPSHRHADIPVCDPCHSTGGVEYCVEIGAWGTLSEVGDASCECRDRANWPSKSVVVDDCALRAILGVGDQDGSAVGK